MTNKYLVLTLFFRKVTLMKMMEYRTDFIFWAGISILWTFFNFFFFFLIIQLTDEIGGWNQSELFVLISTFTILDAFTWSFFYRNFRFYTNAVFTGFLDFMLTRPVDAQFLLTTQDNSYTNIFRLFIGIIALIWSATQLDNPVTLIGIIGYVILLCCSLVMIYSLWFFLTTFAFWVEKLDNINEIFPSMRDIFRVPRTVYTGVISLIFSTIFPVLLVTSVPSEVLIGKAEPSWIIFFLFATCTSFIISRRFFHFSLSKYQSVGS